MRVVCIKSDSGACGKYRVEFPAEVLIRDGYDIVVQELTDSVLEGFVSADAVILQRPQHKLMIPCIEKLQARDIRVVIEMDDNFNELREGSPTRVRLDPYTHPDNNWEWTARAIEVADDLIASTQGIVDEYGKGHVVKNYVPSWYLEVNDSKPTGPLRVGWTGDPRHHVGDMACATPALRAVCPPALFCAVGSRATLNEIGMGGEHRPFEPVEKYIHVLRSSLDIGVAPLADNAFTRCKSWLKPLEYASLGIPFVASPSPEYRALGLGSVGEGWIEPLELLVSLSRDELYEEGERLRQAVKDRQLTYEDHALEFWETWIGS